MATIVLVGTMDTKGQEYVWLRDRLIELGNQTILVDAGTFSNGELPDGSKTDFTAADLAQAAGQSIQKIRSQSDRGTSMTVMSDGAALIVEKLFEEGKLQGILAVGGSGGSAIASAGMKKLPVGVPKLLVSTMAAGNISPYVGATDVTVMPSVVDVAGINRISRMILGNAVAAISAMAQHYVQPATAPDERPIIGATMFGVTTPAVDEARERLSKLGYEVLVFHATGTGGQAMEALAKAGMLDGVLDLTTTELVDDQLEGVLSAGPERLEAAGQVGLPQVVSVGALDMCNFGPTETVPPRYKKRNLVVHNPTVTLMRTTKEEMSQLGQKIATKLKNSSGPVEVWIPLRGVSAIDVEGGPFYDPDADAACFSQIREGLKGSNVVLVERDQAINDPGFGTDAANALHQLIIKNAQEHKRREL